MGTYRIFCIINYIFFHFLNLVHNCKIFVFVHLRIILYYTFGKLHKGANRPQCNYDFMNKIGVRSKIDYELNTSKKIFFRRGRKKETYN